MTEFNLKYSPPFASFDYLLRPLDQNSIWIIAPQIFRDFPLSFWCIISYSCVIDLWLRLFGPLPWAAPTRAWTDRVTTFIQLSQSRSLVAIRWGICLVSSTSRSVFDTVSAITNQILLSFNAKVVLSSFCIRLGSLIDIALSLLPVGSGVFEVIILINHLSSVVWWSVYFVVCNVSWIENDARAPRVLMRIDSYPLGQRDNSNYRNKFHFKWL